MSNEFLKNFTFVDPNGQPSHVLVAKALMVLTEGLFEMDQLLLHGQLNKSTVLVACQRLKIENVINPNNQINITVVISGLRRLIAAIPSTAKAILDNVVVEEPVNAQDTRATAPIVDAETSPVVPPTPTIETPVVPPVETPKDEPVVVPPTPLPSTGELTLNEINLESLSVEKLRELCKVFGISKLRQGTHLMGKDTLIPVIEDFKAGKLVAPVVEPK